MKRLLIISAMLSFVCSSKAQTKEHKFGVTAGGSIQQYKGNLGNSFFRFKETCFGGVAGTFGYYLNRSFDVNLGVSVGHFGYCQTEEDKQRIVGIEYRCPGCTNELGMGELRSLMVSGNIFVKYKFGNGYLLKEDSKFAPYVYLGAGINQLSDVMKKQCVNIGTHYSIISGAGIKYNICKRMSIGYNLQIGYFPSSKVYNTSGTLADDHGMTEEEETIHHTKDMYLQHSLFLGFNF
jgi:OmpA-OmpF porin, OOP family